MTYPLKSFFTSIIKNRFLKAGLILAALVIFFNLFFEIKSVNEYPDTQTGKPCTPTFKDGDGPYYYPDAPFRTDLAPEKNNGEKLIVRGRLLQNDCRTAVPGAVLDIWQADETGTYQKDWYRGKIRTGDDGGYYFETIMPEGYGEGTGYRPPHIHFKVISEDGLIITSEMFFPDVIGREGFNEAYVMKLEKKKKAFGKEFFEGSHDIIIP